MAGAEEAQEVVDALNATASALVRPHTGVFTRFDDDDLTQTPLKVSRVELALPDGTVRAVTAADIHHLAGARTRALHRAAVLYVDHTVPAVDAGEEHGAPVDPAALATFGGTDATPAAAWTPALSLRTGEPYRVPVSAARPFGPHNRLRTHLAATAGAGPGVRPPRRPGPRCSPLSPTPPCWTPSGAGRPRRSPRTPRATPSWSSCTRPPPRSTSAWNCST
ncbi:hypothetical protein ACFQVA_26050 [Actinomadura keratinilytica]